MVVSVSSSSAATTSVNAPGLSRASLQGNANDLNNNNNKEDKDNNDNIDKYDNNALSVASSSFAQEGAGASMDGDTQFRKAHLLCAISRRNKDYCRSKFVGLPDTSAKVLAMFKDVELQAQMFFAFYLSVWAERFF
jgi:hypothetical protein